MGKATPEKSDKRGKIILTKNAIYFANDGNPFGRLDVLALCLVGLSGKDPDKDNRPTDDFEDEKCDQEWLNSLANGYQKMIGD